MRVVSHWGRKDVQLRRKPTGSKHWNTCTTAALTSRSVSPPSPRNNHPHKQWSYSFGLPPHSKETEASCKGLSPVQLLKPRLERPPCCLWTAENVESLDLFGRINGFCSQFYLQVESWRLLVSDACSCRSIQTLRICRKSASASGWPHCLSNHNLLLNTQNYQILSCRLSAHNSTSSMICLVKALKYH